MSDSTLKPLVKTDVRVQGNLFSSPASDVAVLTIEQLNLRIKQLIEGDLGTVWVQGEISNFKAHTSGHFYFSLKDAKSQISAVMFRGNNSRLKFKPTDGLEVIVRGRITVYEPRGNYQILCESMEPVGAGALQKAYEQLREKLKLEGLFEASRKRAIPSFPRHVAIVTSPTGAAIRDILNILGRRAKSVKVTVVPTIVQGEAAAPQIIQAFNRASALDGVDVIIIGRGGGSIEDMWCFNDEILARTIAASAIPVISAVGHEIDFTIADFVADLRAPTPSAAAELVAKSSADLLSKILGLDRLLRISLDRKLKTFIQQMSSLQSHLVDPRKRLQDLVLRNDDLLTRLDLAAKNLLKTRLHRIEILRQRLGKPSDKIKQCRQALKFKSQALQNQFSMLMQKNKARTEKMMSVLDSLSPLKVVERGYSIVTKKNEVVKSFRQLKAGDEINIRLAEGSAVAQVTVSSKADGKGE